MSRLDSFIRRMSAQRDILNTLPPRLSAIPGHVLEFGLGSGRTYDHLRELFPDRRILVFESVVSAWVSAPPRENFLVGDIRDTATGLLDGCAALVHADIETGAPETDARLAEWLPALVTRLLAPGGFAVSGSALAHPGLAPCPLPATVAPDRYHLVRRL